MHQQGVERLDLDPPGVAVFEVAHLVAYDLDPLVGREQRALRVVAGDPDDQMIHHIQGAADDVAMAVGDRIEGAGIDPDAPFHLSSPSPLLGSGSSVSGLSSSAAVSSSASSPFSATPFSSATSGSRATETTRSPSPSLKITTPWLRRRAMRMSLTGQRITMPASVTSMIWSLCPTEKTATTASRRRLKSMLSMP